LKKNISLQIESSLQNSIKIILVESPFRKKELHVPDKGRRNVHSHWCIDLNTMTLKLESNHSELNFNIRRAKRKFFTDNLIKYDTLCKSAFLGDEKKFFSLLTQFNIKDLRQLRSSREQTVLYATCVGGKSLKILLWLINKSLPLSSKQGPKGSTPLHAASWYGHPEFVACLLDAGADPQVKNDLGWTASAEATLAVKPIFQAWNTSRAVGNYLPKITAMYRLSNRKIIGLEDRAPYEEIIIHILIIETATTQKLGLWSFHQDRDLENWETNLSHVLSNINCRITLQFKVESLKKEGGERLHIVNFPGLAINLLKEQNGKGDLKTENSKVALSFSIIVTPLFSDNLGDMINSEWENPTGFNKQVFQQFYARIYTFYHQYQELANSEKVSATLSKIYATAVAKKKGKVFSPR